MAKSIKEQVEADVAKAQAERRAKKLEEDYHRWIAAATQPQISQADIEHYKSLAAETLAKLRKLKK